MYGNNWNNSGNGAWGNSNENNSFSSGFGSSPTPTPPPSPSGGLAGRHSPNYIAAVCAVLFIVCFLFLPFIKIAVFPISGFTFMCKVNALMCIPLVLGILMVISSLMLDRKVSIGVGAVTAVTLLILFLCSRSIILSGNGLGQLISLVRVNYDTVSQLGEFVRVPLGVGGVLSILLCLVFIFVEIFLADGIRTRARNTDGNIWPTL
ncbi:MAG: hypothetical protein E7331_10845 [Clostridiales bacterium]|nr:hypothetical protein [Clostridiales bacterium]